MNKLNKTALMGVLLLPILTVPAVAGPYRENILMPGTMFRSDFLDITIPVECSVVNQDQQPGDAGYSFFRRAGRIAQFGMPAVRLGLMIGGSTTFYQESGTAKMQFATPTSGTIFLPVGPNSTYPTSFTQLQFNKYVQTWDNRIDTLTVSFTLVFPSCASLPINAVYTDLRPIEPAGVN